MRRNCMASDTETGRRLRATKATKLTKSTKNYLVIFFVTFVGFVVFVARPPSAVSATDVEWRVHGGDYNIRYSPLTQIDKSNVTQLKVAWTYTAGDEFKGSEMQ